MTKLSVNFPPMPPNSSYQEGLSDLSTAGTSIQRRKADKSEMGRGYSAEPAGESRTLAGFQLEICRFTPGEISELGEAAVCEESR